MELKEIFENLLVELQPLMPPVSPPAQYPSLLNTFGAGAPPPMPLSNMAVQNMQPPSLSVAPPPETSDTTLELPNVNMTVSFFPPEKKIILAPQDHNSTTEKIKSYLSKIKQHLRIYNINKLDGGAFEIVFDPRENFQTVMQFMQQLAQL